jgi:hypothetical protein
MKPEDKAKIQQALDVIETPIHEQPFMAKQKAITALRQLLEQPADHGDELTIAYLDGVHTGKQMAKREWVGLTDEELYAVCVPLSPQEIARAIEAKLKEKNT